MEGNRAKSSRTKPSVMARIGPEDVLGGLSPPGGLFPPPRAETAPATNGAPKQKRSLFEFDFGRRPVRSTSLGKRKIGNPILQDNPGLNPLNKIATMDLREAAQVDKERRAKALRESSDLWAEGPAPSTAEAPTQTVHMERKEARPPTSQPSTMLSVPTSSLMPGNSIATSSATWLPAGGEDLRRRSPRHPLQSAPLVSRALPARQAQPARFPDLARPGDSAEFVAHQEARAHDVARQPTTRKTQPPELAKTPLQRRPTNGLPSNPRARGLTITKERQQTILFFNNIVYHDPETVENIMAGTNDTAAGTSHKPDPTSDTPVSVVHRPRPVPRRMADPPFASRIESSHRRSKSGGSLLGRMTFAPVPGSLSELPPLPPRPRSAGCPARPLPKDTKRMTVDEETTLVSPALSTGNTSKQILVPQVPPLRTAYPGETYTPTGDGSALTSGTTVERDDWPIQDVGDGGSGALAKDEESLSAVGRQHPSSPVLSVGESAWTNIPQSPRHAMGVPVARQMAAATTISQAGLACNVPNDSRGSELVTVMLDAGFDERPPLNPQQRSQNQWHRRVGDDCPTFSGRQEKVRSRKMPPPTPLLLNDRKPVGKPVLIQAPEASPLESPGHALRQIQDQLLKFEAASDDALASPSQRMALLENLEQEMGDQENQWRDLQHDLGRDSMCSIHSSPRRQSRPDSMSGIIPISRASSIRSLIGQEPRASRVTRLAEAQTEFRENAMNLLVKRSLDVLANEAPYASSKRPDSDNSDHVVPAPQQRPHEADALIAQRVASRPPSFLWKPVSAEQVPAGPSLWIHVPETRKEAQHVSELPTSAARRPCRKDTRPLGIESKQLWQQPLDPENKSTTGLWGAIQGQPIRPSGSMTQRTPVQAQGPPKAPRPVTQRPPRRSRRATMLPDIVENPEPLPDKRGTLGIYQFPWGEKSDTATHPPWHVTNYMAMSGSLTLGDPLLHAAYGMYNHSKQVEPSECSSYFDDYEDDESDDDDSEDDDSASREKDDDEEDDSDNAFDESTLWEIASLLKTDNLPSKNSLLPPAQRLSAVDDYYIEEISEFPFDLESVLGDDLRHAVDSPQQQPIVIGVAEEPEAPPTEQSRREGLDAVVPESLLWSAPSSPRARGDHGKGLPHPHADVWERYVATVDTVRAKPRRMAEEARIESSSLWNSEGVVASTASTGLKGMSELGEASKPSLNPYHPVADATNDPVSAVNPWGRALGCSADVDASESEPIDLLRPKQPDKRTTPMERAAKDVERKPPSPRNKLVSEDLWVRGRISPQARFVESTHGLWSPPLDLDSSSGGGLFEADRTRTIRRTTAREPAAMLMVPRRFRPGHPEPVEQLSSTSLWAPSNTEMERNWMSDRVVA